MGKVWAVITTLPKIVSMVEQTLSWIIKLKETYEREHALRELAKAVDKTLSGNGDTSELERLSNPLSN
jgi:hypothetical protein